MFNLNTAKLIKDNLYHTGLRYYLVDKDGKATKITEDQAYALQSKESNSKVKEAKPVEQALPLPVEKS